MHSAGLHCVHENWQITTSKRTYQKVLRLDAYHQIALKNLKKLGSLSKKDLVKSTAIHTTSPLMFLEEPGKTKIVECVHIAPSQVLSRLASGQEVFLKAKNHVVEVRDEQDRYLAAIPDDLSFKLIKFLAGGTRLSAAKGADAKSLKNIFTKHPAVLCPPAFLPQRPATSCQRRKPGIDAAETPAEKKRKMKTIAMKTNAL
jgi:hypothetical protein